jgi:hydrogenase maturation factor
MTLRDPHDRLVTDRYKAMECLTCSDQAVAARVQAVAGREAVVAADGRSERVAIDLVPDAAPGDLLLCHAGIALERLDTEAVS